MYDYFDETPAPIDSSDLYEMGLRAPRCNGCKYAKLKHKLGDKFLSRIDGGWVAVYELDAEPRPEHRPGSQRQCEDDSEAATRSFR